MNPYLRYPLIYGLLSGTVMIVVLIIGFNLPGREVTHSYWFGYLVQIVAMTFVFVGLKRYRDVEMGGVIGFWRALGMAALIVLVATLAYVLIWEAYMAATNYTFMDNYIASMLADMKAAGKPAAEIAQAEAEMRPMADMYNNNPLFRIGLTATELLLPVGPAVALLSAVLLRNPKFLPAR